MNKPACSSLLLLSLLAVGALGANVPAQAVSRPLQTESFSQLGDTLVAGLPFRVGARSSRWRIGGFSRTALCDSGKELVAVAPPVQPHEEVDARMLPADPTASPHPTLFVYVPEMPPTAAQFTLQTDALPGEGPDELYSVRFPLDGKAGIVGIQIPDSVPPLQVGENYLWQVSARCATDTEVKDLVVISWVERVSAEADANSPLGQAESYAEQGIWQETLSTIAQLRLANPSNREIAADWASLMTSVGLDELADTPIIQIVSE